MKKVCIYRELWRTPVIQLLGGTGLWSMRSEDHFLAIWTDGTCRYIEAKLPRARKSPSHLDDGRRAASILIV